MAACRYLSGYLINHPWANILFAQSESHAGEPVWSAHHDLIGETTLTFSADAPVNTADVIFLCMGHGKSRGFVEKLPKDFNGKIIDLSNDFRLQDSADGFVYGLPEAFRQEIKAADKIANPGFSGHLYILLDPDSTFQVRRVELTIPRRSDVNFVENMMISQDFIEPSPRVAPTCKTPST